MLLTLENLSSNTVKPQEPWSIWRDFEVPDYDSSSKLKRWATQADTKYLVYSTYEGTDPTLRVSTKNKAYRMVGVVADYDLEYTDEYQKENIFQTQFQDVLFSRIMPNLKKIGLLKEELVPEYEKLGVMGYADGDSDYETSWEELSKPLKTA